MNILQADSFTLTVDQWDLLSNIVHCFEEYNGVLLAEHFVCEQTTLSLQLRFKYSSVRHFILSLLSKTRLLLENNADFLSLCAHDRSTLLHTSTRSTTILSASFIVRQSRLLDHAEFLQSTKKLLGLRTWNIIRRLINQLDFDLTFIKLILSILSFSTNNYTVYTNAHPINLVNTKTIIHIHDRYVELAWRYVLNRCDYHQTVICFSKVVSCLLTLNDILVEVQEDKFFTSVIDFVVEQTKQTLVHFE